MILIYPRLPHSDALMLSQHRSRLSIEAARKVADTTHTRVTYAATGGMRIQESNLAKLAEQIRALAHESGYPAPRSVGARDRFDGRLGKLLHEHSGLSPSEACRDGVWSFLACVLVPDVVRWRFPGEETTAKNFLGKDRGIDNALGRCWWAAELLLEEQSPDDPYELLLELGVDESVGFSRRSRAVVNRRVAVGLARMVVTVHAAGLPFTRLDLMRDVMKRFLRLASFVSFESLTELEFEHCVRDLVTASASAVALSRNLDYDPLPFPVEAKHGPDSNVATGAVSNSAADPNRHLSELLTHIDVDSRSPSRFLELKAWLAAKLLLEVEQVAVKRLNDFKNYRNRIGEALRQRPFLAVFLHSGDDDEALAALRSRQHLCSHTVTLLCAERGGGWAVDTVVAPSDIPFAAAVAEMFRGARVEQVEVREQDLVEIPPDVEDHIVEAVRSLPLGKTDVVDSVEAMVNSLIQELGGHVQVKRILDIRNVENRISESYGRGACVHVFGTRAGLLDSTQRAAEEQSREVGARIVIILSEDEDGSLVHVPIILRCGEAHDDMPATEVELEVAVPLAPVPDILDVDDSTRPDEVPSELGLLEIESLEERAGLVAEHLLFLGPLSKSEAIRAAAESLRDVGGLSYQRLRTDGRIYTALLAAIEMGVRTGHLDRPRRGQVRAVIELAEEYTREDWLAVVKRALPCGEIVTRYDAVRIAGAWARENLGLEYMRIRGNGKIDRGIRNAFRALLRRDEMQAVSRDEIMLRADS